MFIVVFASPLPAIRLEWIPRLFDLFQTAASSAAAVYLNRKWKWKGQIGKPNTVAGVVQQQG
jgi:hypothetical protein